MDTEILCPKQKMSAKRPSKNPSFVYRQDGYELSYEIVRIIPWQKGKVKIAFADGVCYNTGKKGGVGMKESWLRQRKLASYMLLATVIATVINVALLLGNGDLNIPYCASVPYYLVWLGKAFDNGLNLAGQNLGDYTLTGMVLCFGLLVPWLVVWFLSRQSRAWLWTGLGLVIADTALLLILALALFGSPMTCLLELALHGAVIWEVSKGLNADAQLRALAMDGSVMEQQPTREEIVEE